MTAAKTRLAKLLSIASPPTLPSLWETPPTFLVEMLVQKNGFYAFEGALHVFCSGSPAHERGLEEWNSDSLWRSHYERLSPDLVFFAEDIFGMQFCSLDGSISIFDPETGELEPMATDLEDWAAKLLDDYPVLTGYPLAHEWQNVNGALSPGERLLPKIPFVLGGEYSVTNLYSLDAVKGMHARASLARQIRDLPDGTKIEIDVVE